MTHDDVPEPGMLVRPKFNENVALWREYTTYECGDGARRAQMKKAYPFPLSELALIIAVPFKWAGWPLPKFNIAATCVVQLYVPSHNLICFVRPSLLMVVSPALGA